MNENMRNRVCFLVFLLLVGFMGCAGGPHPRKEDTHLKCFATESTIESSQLDTYVKEKFKERGPLQEGEVEWRILKWPQDKRAAVSLTFDDGTLDQYEVAAPLLGKAGIRATFFIITGPRGSGVWMDGAHPRALFSWSDALEIAKQGHEIGSHGISHSDLRRLWWKRDRKRIEGELEDSKTEILRYIPKKYLPGGADLSFSWPYWRTTPGLEQLAGEYYVAGRSGEGVLPLEVVRKPYAIHSKRVMSHDSIESWSRHVQKVRQSKGWLLLTLHGIDNGNLKNHDIGWQPIREAKFEALLEMVAAEDLWTAPFGEVYRYSRERNRAHLVVEAMYPDRIFLRVEDGLDDQVFNIPLTVELSLPQSLEGNFEGGIVETLSGLPVSEVVLSESPLHRKVLQFSLVPKGEIVVIRSSTSTAKLYKR